MSIYGLVTSLIQIEVYRRNRPIAEGKLAYSTNECEISHFIWPEVMQVFIIRNVLSLS